MVIFHNTLTGLLRSKITDQYIPINNKIEPTNEMYSPKY